MSSKKTVLKETPTVPASSQQKVKRKNDYLRECINVIVKRELLHLNIKKVFDIMVDDLHINLKNIAPRMKYVLCECLCYYLKMWPGWQKYDVVCTNERSKVEYIEKFKQYLIFKINYIIENERLFDLEAISAKRPLMVTQEIQTEPVSKRNKPEAPYNLVISGQPNVLNNIVFIELDGDIVIKQHAEKPWKPLTVAEFLNYSFVNVAIQLPDLELTRSNLHEFQRYITESGDCASCPEVDFITYIRKRNTTSKPKVYSMDYIHAYCKQFLDTIKKIQGINPVKITELEEVFRQFILDIKESDVFSSINSVGKTVNTMATDTTVCFNIGRKTYIRNKKMVVNTENQKETNAINFCEVLIPRMAYSLTKFEAEEDVTTEDTTFKSLNAINKEAVGSEMVFKFIETVNNSVTYHCLLCPKVYVGERAYIDILDHYRFLHKGEQSVLCFTCRKQFTIAKLAGSRWSHDCTGNLPADLVGNQSGFVDSLVTNPPATVTKTPIGINDILSSGKSTISFDDLFTAKPGVVDMTPVTSKINTISTVSNTSVINTLPVVRVSTGNGMMPTGGVLLTIASSPNTPPTAMPRSVRILSKPISIAPKPATISINPSTVSSGPTTAPSEIAIFSDPVSTSVPSITNDDFDIEDNKDDIQSKIDMQLANAYSDVPGLAILNQAITPSVDMDTATSSIPPVNVAPESAAIIFAPLNTTPVNTVSLHIPPLVLTTTDISASTDPVSVAAVDDVTLIPSASVSTVAPSVLMHDTAPSTSI